jgi:hypothetical protein
MIDKAGAEGQAKTSPTCEGLSDEVVSGPAPARADLPPGYHLDSEQLDLQKLGCSDWPQTTTYGEVFKAEPPEAFSYAASSPSLGIGLAITLAVSLAVYGVVRAIGWVIGGFAATDGGA